MKMFGTFFILALSLAGPTLVRAEENSSSGRQPASYIPPGSNDQDRAKLLPDQALPSPDEEKPPHFSAYWTEQRDKLGKLGIDFALIYKGELNSTLNGSLKKDTIYMDNLDVRLLLDFGKIANLDGLSFFAYGLGNQRNKRETPSENLGNTQVTSNIENDNNGFKLYELWLQQQLFDEKASILFGLHDLNSEFYVSDAAGLFLNSSFGVGPELAQTGEFGPSIFPNTSTALRLRVEATPQFYLMTALFNAVADDPTNQTVELRGLGGDGLIAISEVGYIAKSERGQGKFAAGTWAYDMTFENLEDTTQKSAARGYYLIAEQAFHDLSVFVKYGAANSSTNPVASSLVFGATYNGLGLGVAQVTYSNDYLRVSKAGGVDLHDTETAIELTYRWDIVPGFAIQPDYQVILQPGGSSDVDVAESAALRIELSF